MENEHLKKLVLIAACFALPLLILGVTYVSTSNKEVRLRNQVTAQQDVLRSHHDKMWKTLKQKAKVSDEYKDTFAEVYPDLIAGRYSNDGGTKAFLAKFVKEDNPDFDTSLYKDLSRSIEAERTSYHKAQSKLLDIKREHDDVVMTFPGSVLLANLEPVEVSIITSSKTEDAFKEGVDDDTNLFD